MPINQGDRVRTTTGQSGRVELVSGGGTLAYVQFDDDPHGENLNLYESHVLAKIDATANDPRVPASEASSAR